jgi:hypothetical protein
LKWFDRLGKNSLLLPSALKGLTVKEKEFFLFGGEFLLTFNDLSVILFWVEGVVLLRLFRNRDGEKRDKKNFGGR